MSPFILQLRDYFDEIQATVSVAAPEWKLQNLCLWNDLVLKKESIGAVFQGSHAVASVEDCEAEVEAAEFASIRTKIV